MIDKFYTLRLWKNLLKSLGITSNISVYSTIFLPHAFIVENNIDDLVLQFPFITQHFDELIRFTRILTVFSY